MVTREKALLIADNANERMGSGLQVGIVGNTFSVFNVVGTEILRLDLKWLEFDILHSTSLEFMLDDEIIAIGTHISIPFLEAGCTKTLSVNLAQVGSVSERITTWLTTDYLAQVLATGMKYSCSVEPKNVITKMATEEFMENIDISSLPIQTHMVATPEEGLKWLLERA